MDIGRVGNGGATSRQHGKDLNIVHFRASDRVLKCPSMASPRMGAVLVDGNHSSYKLGKFSCYPGYCVFRGSLRFHSTSHTLYNLITESRRYVKTWVRNWPTQVRPQMLTQNTIVCICIYMCQCVYAYIYLRMNYCFAPLFS